ncbi:MAG: septation protein SepH [Corynebacterium sp.]|nr:septation protein SepH [Corynebacterium sp.]
MRELFFNPQESTPDMLVFELPHRDPDDAATPPRDGLFALPEPAPTRLTFTVTEEFRNFLLPAMTELEPDADTNAEAIGEAVATPDSEVKASDLDSDPYVKPLPLRPREIQDRIRQGESAEAIADQMNVPVSRIEAFAHPVLMERTRMSEMARATRPSHDGSDSQLTLGELVAAAFAAHDYDLATATWDAYRSPAGPWIITLTWTQGYQEHVAEWTMSGRSTADASVTARNGEASDLINPVFLQSVRVIAVDPTPVEPEVDKAGEAEPVEEAPRHRRRRRKAVTPHWEDVLLGVRTAKPERTEQ